MTHPKIFEFISIYRNIWDSIEFLETQLKSDRFLPGNIDSREEADVKLGEMRDISERIKEKVSELEMTRSLERDFLNDLISQHGPEHVQKMLEEIKI